MAKCETCKFDNVCDFSGIFRNNVIECRTYEQKEPQTQGNKIRSFSDEELAEFLIRQHACDKCDYFGGGARCKAPSGFVCTNGYAEALMLQWLKSEVKE